MCSENNDKPRVVVTRSVLSGSDLELKITLARVFAFRLNSVFIEHLLAEHNLQTIPMIVLFSLSITFSELETFNLEIAVENCILFYPIPRC